MSIDILLEMAVAGHGDRDLIRVVTADGTVGEPLTPRRLSELAAAASTLVQRGGHDSVIFIGTWGPAYAVAAFGAASADVPLVPLNYRLGADQLASLVGNHPRALVIADDPDALPPVEQDIAATDRWLAGLDGEDEAEPATSPTAPAVLLYTSGTTSAPKAAILRHDHLVSYVMSTVEFGSAEEDEAALVSVPPYHIAGFANLLSNLYSGRRMVALPSPDVARWWATAAECSITHAFVVPTLLKRLVDHAEEHGSRAPTLRHLSYGGARTPRSTIAAALRILPDTDFTQAYGLTETSSTIAVLGPDDHRASLEEGAVDRLGSVGRPVPGIEIEIRGPDDTALPVGESGRVWLRGPQVSGEYADAASALDADGWFDTRDKGRLDADGYLHIEGRDDDTIIRGAENIAPAEIEDVLLDHPMVREATVVGLDDPEWGQVPVAGVVLTEPGGADAADLADWVRGRLRSSKTPSRIAIWDELPMTDTGKVSRRHVVERMLRDT